MNKIIYVILAFTILYFAVSNKINQNKIDKLTIENATLSEDLKNKATIYKDKVVFHSFTPLNSFPVISKTTSAFFPLCNLQTSPSKLGTNPICHTSMLDWKGFTPSLCSMYFHFFIFGNNEEM